MSLFFFFFFQAEDGIRDVAVTGVQTCALPIAQLLQESRRELAVPMTRKPDLPRAGWIPQREIARGARHTDVVLLHVRLPPVRNAECGMRNGHPPFNSAFRIPHSAFR